MAADLGPDPGQGHGLLAPGVAGDHGHVALGQVPGADLDPDRHAFELPVDGTAAEGGVGAGIEANPVPGGASVR